MATLNSKCGSSSRRLARVTPFHFGGKNLKPSRGGHGELRSNCPLGYQTSELCSPGYAPIQVPILLTVCHVAAIVLYQPSIDIAAVSSEKAFTLTCSKFHFGQESQIQDCDWLRGRVSLGWVPDRGPLVGQDNVDGKPVCAPRLFVSAPASPATGTGESLQCQWLKTSMSLLCVKCSEQ